MTVFIIKSQNKNSNPNTQTQCVCWILHKKNHPIWRRVSEDPPDDCIGVWASIGPRGYSTFQFDLTDDDRDNCVDENGCISIMLRVHLSAIE